MFNSGYSIFSPRNKGCSWICFTLRSDWILFGGAAKRLNLQIVVWWCWISPAAIQGPEQQRCSAPCTEERHVFPLTLLWFTQQHTVVTWLHVTCHVAVDSDGGLCFGSAVVDVVVGLEQLFGWDWESVRSSCGITPACELEVSFFCDKGWAGR